MHPNPLRMLDFKHNHHFIIRMQIINYARQLLILALMFFDVELYEALLIIEVAGPHWLGQTSWWSLRLEGWLQVGRDSRHLFWTTRSRWNLPSPDLLLFFSFSTIILINGWFIVFGKLWSLLMFNSYDLVRALPY